VTIHVKVEVIEDEPSPGFARVEVSELGETHRLSMVLSPANRKEMGEHPAIVHAAKWLFTSLLEERFSSGR
jgi:hypothetical protein